MQKTQRGSNIRRALRATLFLLATVSSVATARSEWKDSPAAVQRIYLKGVPHTDANGRSMLQYDAKRSFLPLAIYHAVDVSYGDSLAYRDKFSDLKQAGFTCAFAYPGADPLIAAKAAGAAGVQLVLYGREFKSLDVVRELAKSPAMLGYYMDDEPIAHLGTDIEKRFAETETIAKAIKAVDKTHAVFHVDGGWIEPPATEWWVKLNTWGDISCHDNYPLNGQNLSLSMRQGIPESVSLAVASNQEKKPLWFVAQCHEWPNPTFNCNFPTAIQQRCMIYTALIHGATGIVQFALDSFVTRDAGVIGISPNPQAKYHIGVVATSAQLRQSHDLWNATATLNAELAQLKPSLLSPTADVPYEIALDDTWKPITKTPVRALLKTDPAGGYNLLLTNIDSWPQHVRVRFPHKKFTVKQLFDADSAGQFKQQDDSFELLAAAYDARIFHIGLLP